MDDISLHHFATPDELPDMASYIHALEAFDGIPQMQELKALAREHGDSGRGRRVLDVGCGFGLETMRLAMQVGPAGRTAGIDKNQQFITVARERAKAAALTIEYRVGDAENLPYADDEFDHVRVERLLMYLENPHRAVQEMKRVCKAGGCLAMIEADFSTININLPDRRVVRRALACEIETAVAIDWLPGLLFTILDELDCHDVRVETRTAIFPQDLAADYFSGVGKRATEAGALTDDELEGWQRDLKSLHQRGLLFATVGYFLFSAQV